MPTTNGRWEHCHVAWKMSKARVTCSPRIWWTNNASLMQTKQPNCGLQVLSTITIWLLLLLLFTFRRLEFRFALFLFGWFFSVVFALFIFSFIPASEMAGKYQVRQIEVVDRMMKRRGKKKNCTFHFVSHKKVHTVHAATASVRCATRVNFDRSKARTNGFDCCPCACEEDLCASIATWLGRCFEPRFK